MKKEMALLCLAMTALSGCSTFEKIAYDGDYITTTHPTLETVQASSQKKQVYKKTIYLASDFHENGSLKMLSEYDFSKESAPCTVLSAYQEPAVYRESFYKLNQGNERYNFTCKSMNNGSEYRLFHVGSLPECKSRAADLRTSMIKEARDRGYMCDKYL